ncbi:MAG: hypothetical protein AAFN77_10925 [Planctomycetota bacterium]
MNRFIENVLLAYLPIAGMFTTCFMLSIAGCGFPKPPTYGMTPAVAIAMSKRAEAEHQQPQMLVEAEKANGVKFRSAGWRRPETTD